ncbi:TPA: ABC transporter permease [Candidatus Sumerlaeota bacterium]|nr:ABC transporter permease [Candidatus Sumerlaeota bacterium]
METSVNKELTVNIPIQILAGIGRLVLALLTELGRIGLFFFTTFSRIIHLPHSIVRIAQQIHFIGTKSLFIVSLTGLFTGMVLGVQLYYTLSRLGSETALGVAVALSLIRELGPVLTALMITGRAGSSIAAEIGIMRISEQIDALDTMDIDPIKFLVVPRLLAALLCFPLLTAIFDVIGIVGGYLTGVVMLGVNSGTYLNRMEQSVVWADVSGGFIKSFAFAIIVSVICCYQGYTMHLRRNGFGARGVSVATTSAVVISSVLILATDYVLTSFLL